MTTYGKTLSSPVRLNPGLFAAAAVAAAAGIAAILIVGQLHLGSPARQTIVTGNQFSGSRPAVMSQLNSEYLREIAQAWFPPKVTRASVQDQLNSEYLRQIAKGWYGPQAPARVTKQASVMNQLNSEYLREMAQGWFAKAAVLDQLNSEYLREIARGW